MNYLHVLLNHLLSLYPISENRQLKDIKMTQKGDRVTVVAEVNHPANYIIFIHTH